MTIRSMVMMLALTCACAEAPTGAQQTDVRAYTEEQSACVAKYSTRDAIDACRAEVRASHGQSDDGGRDQ